MSKVSKHTNSPDANARANNWMADRAVGWLVFGVDWDDVETVSLTEAGRAASAICDLKTCDICGHSQASHSAAEPRRCSE